MVASCSKTCAIFFFFSFGSLRSWAIFSYNFVWWNYSLICWWTFGNRRIFMQIARFIVENLTNFFIIEICEAKFFKMEDFSLTSKSFLEINRQLSKKLILLLSFLVEKSGKIHPKAFWSPTDAHWINWENKIFKMATYHLKKFLLNYSQLTIKFLLKNHKS